MFRFRSFRFSVFLALAGVFLFPLQWSQGIQSANLVQVSVTLSNPRLSYSAILDANNTAATNLVTINTTPGAAPSVSTTNLFEGEAVQIGAGNYTVASVSADTNFTITAGLNSGDADTGDAVIALRRPEMRVGFQTVTSMQQNWSFRVLVPAGSTDPDDGIPDDDGWDYGSATAANIALGCPTGNTYTMTRGIADVTIGSQTYHSFTCTLTDATVLAPGTNFTANPIIIGSATPAENLINPAPNSTHISGYADSYPIVVQQLDDSDAIIDQTVAAVAVVDAVRVTASVPPQISFRILGVASGASRCGITTDTATTSTLAPFGELFIESFKNMAQELVVSTNARNGYVVTAVEQNQLHRVGETCTGDADESDGGCIQDTLGDAGGITHTTPGLWTDEDSKGFGYSLQAMSLSPQASVAFAHNSTGVGDCNATSGGCWRQFADAEDAQAPVSILSSTGVADNDTASVCYRAIVSASQVSGTDYSTYVTYRATATF